VQREGFAADGQGLTLVHFSAQLEQLQDTFMSQVRAQLEQLQDTLMSQVGL
jgi:hypothetical protein